MKTAVSIPDPVFHKAESAARQMRMNRSQFYAYAIAKVASELDEQSLTAAIDAALADQSSGLDDDLRDAADRTLVGDGQGW